VEEPLFDQLRTKEQLGYHVGATVRMNYGIAGYSIVVNSQETNTTASHVDKRIEHFRNSMMQMIEDMAEEEYDHIKDSLIKLKLVADMALSTEVTRNWTEIINEEYMFDRRRQQIEVLRTLDKGEIVSFLLHNELDNLRKVSVQVIGHQPTSKTLPTEDETKTKPAITEKKQENEDEAVEVDEDEEDEDDDVEMDDVDEELFEMLANKLNVTFLPPDGDASTILDIAEFKSNLNLYPKPAISLDETKRPTLIEDALMNT